MAQRGTWQDVRGRGFYLAVAIAFAGAMIGHSIYTALTAKAPGDSHCYGGVCHTVYTLEETSRMIGQTVDLVATHYDWPEFDKFNVGKYTSSGEEFDAGNAARVSASNFPDGTELLLWHPGSRRASHVRVNDFGPFKGNRTLDVTRRNAEVMGWAKNGVATLRVTVIWVPSPQEARYRKGRVYPPSLGLIGVVEPQQYQALAQMLIRTAPARNSGGEGLPNAVALLSSLPVPPPRFYVESMENAAEQAAFERKALASLVEALPPIKLPPVPEVAAVYVGPPAFRSEPIADAARVAEASRQAIAAFIADRAALQFGEALPAELQPPIVMAEAPRARASVPAVQPTFEPAPVARPLPVLPPPGPVPSTDIAASAATRTEPVMPPSAPERAVPGDTPVIETVAIPTNRTTVTAVERPVLSGAPSQAPVGAAAASSEAPEAPVVEAVVASARTSGRMGPIDWLGMPALWIGIGLMLSSLWGASAFSRSRRSRAAVAVEAARASPPPAVELKPADTLNLAREIALRAEARAQVAYTQVTEQGPAQSEEEIAAREELAHELAQRDLEREQEAATRARLAAAAAAHETAQRELAALEAAKARRVKPAEPVLAPIAAPVPVQATVLASGSAKLAPPERRTAAEPAKPIAKPAPAPKPEPPRALANDAEMARFGGLTDRALVGGILGLPGAAGYWGNTIIARMRLDGSARSGSPMRIDGAVDGACLAPVLLISEGATATGIIAAETVVVFGKVSGTISARHVFVAATAEVSGEIYYESMSIDPQAHCDVSFSRLPKESDPVELAAAVYKARAA